MDKIIFSNLRFWGWHGAFRHEQLRGQYFELDLELSCDLLPAGLSDRLEDGTDYGRLYDCVKAVVCERRFHLLEALGDCICREVLERFPSILAMRLRLRKPQAPLEGGILPDEYWDMPNASWSVKAEPGDQSASAPIPAWNSGAFGPGGSVGIEIFRRRET